MAENKQQEGLKRQLGFGMCLILAIGGCLGTGIFAYTGSGIALAGTGVPIAFVLGGLLTMFLYIPSMYLSSVIPATGGTYMYVSRFVHPVAGYAQILTSVIGSLNLAVFAMTFANYFAAIVPGLNTTIAALVALFILAVIATFGAKASTVAQNVVVVCTILALGVFVFFGFGAINPEYVTLQKVFGADMAGIFAAVAILRYTLQGGAVVMSLGDEVKNPNKTIPAAFFIGTSIVAVIYFVVSYVAVGVAPLDVVANQPLSTQAAIFLKGPLFTFFVVAGGMLATLMSLNTGLLNYSRMHWVAARDGVWPSVFKKLNKNQVPFVTLWVMVAVAAVIIVTQMSITVVVSLVSLPGMLLAFLFYLPPILVGNKLPHCAANAGFKVPRVIVIIVAVLSVLFQLTLAWALIQRLTPTTMIGLGIFFAIGLIYWVLRNAAVKKAEGTSLTEKMRNLHPYWLETEEKYKKAAQEAQISN